MTQASERLQKLQKQQQQQNEAAFLNALSTFHKSANDLLAAWLRADHTGDYFNADYPFPKCFSEVIDDIKKWKDTQNNVGFSGEAIKPASTFINSILEEERKDFPKNIEVTIETSNNPHGNYEMNVIAEDEILARYWYDTREEAQQDADKLEDFFEVTFN